jgi:tricorn protease
MPQRNSRFSFRILSLTASFTCLILAQSTHAEHRQVQMANDPTLSPDGKTLAFSWANDVWSVPSHGGVAHRLTNHSSIDSQPKFSPDGSKLAFVSNRTGSDQIYVMPADGGVPEQKTFHSEGYDLADWYPDGQSVLAIGQRDHFWRSAQRMLQVDITKRQAEKVLLDDAAANASLSPDGKKILFTREGERWWRKGYRGERASQVWQLDLASGQTSELLHEGVECSWPLWLPNGNGFYFTKGDAKGFDLWKYRFSKAQDRPAKQKRIAGFDEDSIVKPTISRDGSTIVFRHLFDLYLFNPQSDAPPKRIDIQIAVDTELPDDALRSSVSRAEQVAFSEDGLDIVLAAGGDLWAMDSELKEPIQITKTNSTESEPLFAPDGKSLWFTRLNEGQIDIWKIEPKNPNAYWWQQKEFVETQITNTPSSESDLRFTPNGKQLLFQKGRGDLICLDIDSKESKVLVDGFSEIDFSISHDSRWIAYASQDNDFNSEIWLMPLDQSQLATNVSRHPDNDRNPVFSPDGKLLAFTARRVDEEVDIYYVHLQESKHEETARDRRLEKALETMKKKRSSDPKPANAEKKSNASVTENDKSPKSGSEPKSGEEQDPKKTSKDKDEATIAPITIDLANIHERVRRIGIQNTSEGNLIFAPDGKRLAFSASVEGKSGWYSVEFPDKLQPKLMSATVLSMARWSKVANGILGMNRGTPAKLESGEKLVDYAFTVRYERSKSGRLRDGFNAAWQAMGDIWYDPAMGLNNWDSIRRKYVDAAGKALDERGLAEIVELMLGELNGSHLGFTPSVAEAPDTGSANSWSKPTAHLGVRFDPRESSHKGPGIRVRDVLPDGPADRKESTLLTGDIVLSIDGIKVDPEMDLTLVLNGVSDRDIVLQVQRTTAPDKAPIDLTVTIRPISFTRARSLLYDHWLEHNRKQVDKLSDNKLGYLHIRSMDMSSFYEFERQLYNVGYGRNGLVIDVRDNGGGSTTDHLLTALTQPKHAITIPRGGKEGYPHDRMIYATWSKPIVVLCNQNSYSNAEIFSHAIKALGRGKLVGVQTAGGVVSTGVAKITDVGVLRAPFRGWFSIKTGDDMELNGALPDVVVWPKPGEIPQGIDKQLEQAVKTLQEDVANASLQPKPKYATEIRKAQKDNSKE